jgi:RNA polymerase primary sigma factor
MTRARAPTPFPASAFLCQPLAELTRQLTFAPPRRVRQQMAHAEELYWQLDGDRTYPLEFIVFRLTRFRPQNMAQVMLTGAAVQRDLLSMVEQLSRAIADRADAYDPRPLTVTELTRRLGVVEKTLSRYRRSGLFARRLIWPDGQVRLGFLRESVDRFTDARGQKLRSAATFRRIDEPTRHAILMRARRIRARVEISPFAVARHLSRRFSRSTEAIRQLLLRHDRHDPRVAIFPEHTPPLSEKDLRIIYRAYRRGVRVHRLVERFGRSRNAIYRAINLRRAAELHALNIRCAANPTFDLPDAEQIIFGQELSLPDDAPIDGPTETSLFVRYNFLKHCAMQLRQGLDRHHPPVSTLDAIETYLRRAGAVREQIVRAYLRLVASVARKHMTASRATAVRTEADLIGEGSLILLETIETFDPARGNRFSTYLTWALMRRFARLDARRRIPVRHLDPAVTYAAPVMEDPSAERAETSVARLLGRLTERERFILVHHFGLSDNEGRRLAPQTLAKVAAQLSISAERARRIEHGALVKLRTAAVQLDMTLEPFDILAPQDPSRG